MNNLHNTIADAIQAFVPQPKVQSQPMSRDRKEIYIGNRLRKLMDTHPNEKLTTTVNVMADRYLELLEDKRFRFNPAMVKAVASTLQDRGDPIEAKDIPLLPLMVRRSAGDSEEIKLLSELSYADLLILVLKAEAILAEQPRPQE